MNTLSLARCTPEGAAPTPAPPDLFPAGDEALDGLARLAARVFDVPTALVSLVGRDAQFFPGCAGLSEPWSATRSMPLRYAVCPHVVATHAPLLVDDLRADPRFGPDHAAVSLLGLSTYAGWPLRDADGATVGSFCVVGPAPRRWSPRDRDILRGFAELAQAELAVRQRSARREGWSRALADGMIERAPDGIALLELDGRVEVANPAFAAMLGISEQELRQVRIMDRMAPEYTDACTACFSDVVGGKAAAKVQTAFLARDGSRVRCEVSAWRLEGDAPRIQILVRDVRASEASRHALDRSVALLQATLEASRDGVLALDHRGTVLAFNTRFTEIWGVVDPARLRGDRAALRRVWAQVADPAALEARVDALLAAPEAVYQGLLRFADGRAIEMYSAPHRLAGRSEGRVWAFRDVTEKTEAEAVRSRLEVAVRFAAVELQHTFDVLSLPLLLLDQSGCVVRLNAAARELWGVAAYPEVLGRRVDEALANHGIWKGVAEALYAAVRTRRGAATRFADPRGQIWDLLTSVVADSGDDTPRVVVLLRDVTEPERNQQMASLGALVAGVAHEVRNPLFGISSTLDAMEACVHDSAQDPFISGLRQQVQRLGRLMQDLLDYGRPAAFTPQLQPLAPVLRAAAAACAERARRAGVAVRTEPAAELPLLVLDRGRVEQALQNLIENAVAHAPAGSEVRARATLARDGHVYCDVEDRGPGFPEGDLARVFEPFFTRRRGGTGLGLSIVERAAHLHGGWVRAANRTAGGARIRLALPVP